MLLKLLFLFVIALPHRTWVKIPKKTTFLSFVRDKSYYFLPVLVFFNENVFLFCLFITIYLIVLIVVLTATVEKDSHFEKVGIKFLYPQKKTERDIYISFFFGNPLTSSYFRLPLFLQITTVGSASTCILFLYRQDTYHCDKLANILADQQCLRETLFCKVPPSQVQKELMKAEFFELEKSAFFFRNVVDTTIEVGCKLPKFLEVLNKEPSLDSFKELSIPPVATPTINNSQHKIEVASTNWQDVVLKYSKKKIFENGITLNSQKNLENNSTVDPDKKVLLLPYQDTEQSKLNKKAIDESTIIQKDPLTGKDKKVFLLKDSENKEGFESVKKSLLPKTLDKKDSSCDPEDID